MMIRSSPSGASGPTRPSSAQRRARRSAPARAWADSMAGVMPSVRVSRRKASMHSVSETGS